MTKGSHHERIYWLNFEGAAQDCGYVRVRNDGVILSVWIDTEVQRMLFVPEHPRLVKE